MRESYKIPMVELKEIEDKVKRYYENEKLLNMLTSQLEHWTKSENELLKLLEFKKAQVKEDIVYLDVNVMGVNYENFKSINTGGHVGLSQQEKALALAYTKMEREIINLENRLQITSNELKFIESRILTLNLENYCMKSVINNMEDEEIQHIMVHRYKYKKTHLQISQLVNMSASSVCEHLKKALIYISKQYSQLAIGEELALC